MSIFDNIKSLLFVFILLVSDVHRCPRFRKPAQIRINSNRIRFQGSRVYRGHVWHQKYKNRKAGVKNYRTYSFNRLLKISLSLRYIASDPVFGQNRILILIYLYILYINVMALAFQYLPVVWIWIRQENNCHWLPWYRFQVNKILSLVKNPRVGISILKIRFVQSRDFWIQYFFTGSDL